MKFSALRDHTLLVTAAAYGLLVAISGIVPLIGLVVSAFVLFSLWCYSYEVLRYFAQGRIEVPPFEIRFFNPLARWALVFHFLAFLGAIIFANLYLPLGIVVSVLIACLFPASAAVFSVTGNFVAAFSPTALLDVIRITGRDYVVLIASVVVLTIGGVALEGWLLTGSGFFSRLVSSVLEIWALLVVFGLTGSAMHAHRVELDIPGERKDAAERERAERELAWQRALDRAYASIRGGQVEAGYRTLRQFLSDNDGSAAAYYWLVEHLFDWEDKSHAVRVASRLIDQEVESGSIPSALELYRRCRKFRESPDLESRVARPLAEYARSIGQVGIADELEQQVGAPSPESEVSAP